MRDDFYIKQIIEKPVLGPVLDLLIKILPRNNLSCSACLDLFEVIRREKVQELCKHLVQNHYKQLVDLSHLEPFRNLLEQYDNPQQDIPPSIVTTNIQAGGCGPERRPPNGSSGTLMEHIIIDPIQEDYWNKSDDDDSPDSLAITDSSTGSPSTSSANNLKTLVDYNSDEEDTDDVEMTDQPAIDNSLGRTNGEKLTPLQPPERISEKRQREEDEDDAIGKLMLNNKRRNSFADSSGFSPSQNLYRRRNSVGSKEAGVDGPRIAISIASSLKSGIEQKGPQSGDSS